MTGHSAEAVASSGEGATWILFLRSPSQISEGHVFPAPVEKIQAYVQELRHLTRT